MRTETDDWAETNHAVAEVIAERSGEYAPTVVQNLEDLLRCLRSTNRPAPAVSAGYWPTFRLTWAVAEARNLEIEVFEDRYEIYRFFDGKTDIRYEPHMPGDELSVAFEAELPRPA